MNYEHSYFNNHIIETREDVEDDGIEILHLHEGIHKLTLLQSLDNFCILVFRFHKIIGIT